jgi:peptide-methionine (R)-S-oxide reductase
MPAQIWRWLMDWNEVVRIVREGNPPPPRRELRTEEEWRARLSPDAYQVTRLKGTERAFSSRMCSLFTPGRYACACCGTELFDSASKFESGTGWPSFFAPLEGAIGTTEDRSFGMRRVEVHCNRCGGHLGHVFEDGPPPTGLRYCINGVALTFEPDSA